MHLSARRQRLFGSTRTLVHNGERRNVTVASALSRAIPNAEIEHHPDRSRRVRGEVELGVEVAGVAVGDQADIGPLGGGLAQLLGQRGHDALAEALALRARVHGNVHKLKEAAAVADDAAHGHQGLAVADGHAVQRVGQAACGGLGAFGAEAGGNAEAAVFVRGGDADG